MSEPTYKEYVVTWKIELMGLNPRHAAMQALEIQRGEDDEAVGMWKDMNVGQATTFEVMDARTGQTETIEITEADVLFREGGGDPADWEGQP